MNAAQRPTYLHLPPSSIVKFPVTAANEPQQPTTETDSVSARSTERPQGFSTVAVRQSAVLESSVKLTVNLLLAVVAGTTLAKLVPYYQTQRSELQSLQEAVQTAEQSKTLLWDEFSRNFDPQQSPSVMQEYSGKSLSTRRAVVLIDPLKEQ